MTKPPASPLSPQERAEKFAAEYKKLCDKWGCQLTPVPVFTQEGRIVAQNQVQVNDE